MLSAESVAVHGQKTDSPLALEACDVVYADLLDVGMVAIARKAWRDGYSTRAIMWKPWPPVSVTRPDSPTEVAPLQGHRLRLLVRHLIE